MKTSKVAGIANEELEGYLNTWTKRKGVPMTIRPGDPEWPTVMGSSAGAPLARSLTDHPDIFKKHLPTEVTFTRADQGMWDGTFKLEPWVGPS
jgi:hypothetical protein